MAISLDYFSSSALTINPPPAVCVCVLGLRNDADDLRPAQRYYFTALTPSATQHPRRPISFDKCT